MKNLLHCHSRNLHSFPISIENGFYKRVFYAEDNHNLYKCDPLEIAIHPHHADIKITVLEGVLVNRIFELTNTMDKYSPNIWQSFKWNSHINTGAGGFERVGRVFLDQTRVDMINEGESVVMKACELHTVFTYRNEKCVWMIEESVPTCEYQPINYSNWDLTQWTPKGLYIEVGDEVKEKYLEPYAHLL